MDVAGTTSRLREDPTSSRDVPIFPPNEELVIAVLRQSEKGYRTDGPLLVDFADAG